MVKGTEFAKGWQLVTLELEGASVLIVVKIFG